MYCQNHQSCWVTKKINKSLFHWICNQKTYLKWYKLGISKENRVNFHIDNRFIRYLKKLGMDVEVEVKDDVIKDEEDEE